MCSPHANHGTRFSPLLLELVCPVPGIGFDIMLELSKGDVPPFDRVDVLLGNL